MKTFTSSGRSALRRLWLKSNRSAFSETGTIRRPRLMVDVSVIMRHDAATGIQRVVRSVWSQLKALEQTDFDVVPVYAGPSRGYCFAPEDFLVRAGRSASVPVGVRPGDKFLGLDLAAHYLPNYGEQLAAWRANGASVHIVVYDLLPIARPDWFEPGTRRHFSRWFDTLIAHADQALCISDSVAHQLRRRTIGTIAHERMRVGRLHLSGDIAGSLPSAGLTPNVIQTLERVGSRPTVLMIGTIEPRKGYDRALEGFERLWAEHDDSAPDLVIVGKPGWKTTAIQERIRSHPEHGRRLHWLENVSDEGLMKLYEASRAVFLASYDEGFGLPLIEAATHRRWALVRDLPVFREQRLSNVRYFDADSPEDLARELIDLVAVAEAGPPPVGGTAPNWTWCVARLLEEMGLASNEEVRRPPLLRVVS